MKVAIRRCPKCRSEDVYSDESRAAIDISCMVCRACGHENFADSWQIDRDWTEICEARADERNE